MVYFSMYLVLPLLIYGGLSENIFLFWDCTMWDAFHCHPSLLSFLRVINI